jgi:integrase
VLGGLPVAGIDEAHILKVLGPIWTTKPETAGRVRGRIESVLDWATARKYRTGDNPARWRGHLAELLPARAKVQPVTHHAALPYAQVQAFAAELRARDGIGARALEFLLLTATRTGEVTGARWDEIDLHENTWTIPAARMKAGKEHRTPLSDRALEILRKLPRPAGHPYVFAGDRAGRPIGRMVMLRAMRNLRPGLTVHGLRSTFSDWAHERTGYDAHTIEISLAHAVGSAVEKAYRRGDMFEKRRRLMAEWSRYCGQAPAKGAVVALR